MGSSIVYKLVVKYVVSPFDTLVIKYDKKNYSSTRDKCLFVAYTVMIGI
jgi:hypothetical protein